MSEKYIRVEMPDLTKWDVPASIVARSYATYYAEADKETPFDAYLAYVLEDDDELIDWADNNMNWSDVAAHAVRVETLPPLRDYQDGWVNGEKDVIER